MGSDSDDRRAAFWKNVDEENPGGAREELERVLSAISASNAVVAYERASLADFLGDETVAIPLYREALSLGLAGHDRTRALIQLASSLRNTGEPSEAMVTLRDVDEREVLSSAADAFRALALFDDDKPAAALRTALHALAPTLPEYERAVVAYADSLVPPRRQRNVVVALLVRDGHVLAEEYAATENHDFFLRAPGGGLAFGERAAEGIRRELREELDAELDEVRPLGVIENIFESGAKRGHEIMHVFAVRSPHLEATPLDARLAVRDGDTTVAWYPLSELRAGRVPFYPPGALDLLT